MTFHENPDPNCIVKGKPVARKHHESAKKREQQQVLKEPIERRKYNMYHGTGVEEAKTILKQGLKHGICGPIFLTADLKTAKIFATEKRGYRNADDITPREGVILQVTLTDEDFERQIKNGTPIQIVEARKKNLKKAIDENWFEYEWYYDIPAYRIQRIGNNTFVSTKSGIVEIVPSIKDQGFPTSEDDYPGAHKKACGDEFTTFGPEKYLELEKVIAKTIPEGELAGTHDRQVNIKVSAKVLEDSKDPQEIIEEIARHEAVESNIMQINWNFKVRDGEVVYMPPEEYMERVNIFNRYSMDRVIRDELRAKEHGYNGIGYYPPLSESSYQSILKGFQERKEFDMPNLIYKNGTLENQEGFHRALVARDMGVIKIPVHVLGEMPKQFVRALGMKRNSSLLQQVNDINSLKKRYIR